MKEGKQELAKDQPMAERSLSSQARIFSEIMT